MISGLVLQLVFFFFDLPIDRNLGGLHPVDPSVKGPFPFCL